VYSLGATLYTWLAGKTPYHGKGLYSILGSLTNGIPPTPLGEQVAVAPPLQHLVELLMSFDPTVRPASMDEAVTRIDWTRDALAKGASSAPVAPVAAAGPPRPPTPLAHVLVVDDDALLQRLLRRSLSRMGVEVTIASNGAEALLKLHEHRFSLIVSDINMPTLDGMMLLNVLKGQQIVTPVCFLTGGRTPQIVQQATALGAVAVLDKPVNFAELALLVQRYCSPSA
jgi:CheY-like chemotaxis protein